MSVNQKPLVIMLADLSYFNKYSFDTLFVPLNISYVASYAKKCFGNSVEIKLYKDHNELIRAAKDNPPHIIGFSLYFWSLDLTRKVMRQLRQVLGNEVLLVGGGVCIDSIAEEQERFIRKLPDVDALVVGEGEVGFAGIIQRRLSLEPMWYEPIDSVIFLDSDQLVSGRFEYLKDLSEIPSPYLTGMLDEYLKFPFRPMIQTMRGCPYTCKFCCSGKDRYKLRTFPMDQVKEEIDYIAPYYKDLSYFTLFITDENFGIMSRDSEIAEYIRKSSDNAGYPKSVYFYSDKRFTETSQSVVEKLGNTNQVGLCLALQSENEDVLKAIKRNNLPDDKIDEALNWGRKNNIETSTELIFGLPMETRASFISDLNRAIGRGFDHVKVNMLLIMDGTELNRMSARKMYGFNTMYRVQGPAYLEVDGQFSIETEEVVVSSSTFSFEDYLMVRNIGYMLFAIYGLRFYRRFFFALRALGVPVIDYIESFLNPDLNQKWPKAYIGFIDKLQDAFTEELYQDLDTLKKEMKDKYEKNGKEVLSPTRLNIFWGAKLVGEGESWHKDVLLKHAESYVPKEDNEAWNSIHEIMKICSVERIRRNGEKSIPPFIVYYDHISWEEDEFQRPLHSYHLEDGYKLYFDIIPDIYDKLKRFWIDTNDMDLETYLYTAFNTINPRSNLTYSLSIKP